MPEPEMMDLLIDELRELRKDIKELRESFHDFQLQVVAESSEKRGSSKTVIAVISAGVSAVVTLAAALIRGH